MENEPQSPRVNVSTSISLSLHALAKRYNIGWSEALEFGIKFLCAEMGNFEVEYPQNKLSEKITKLNKVISELGEQNAKN